MFPSSSLDPTLSHTNTVGTLINIILSLSEKSLSSKSKFSMHFASLPCALHISLQTPSLFCSYVDDGLQETFPFGSVLRVAVCLFPAFSGLLQSPFHFFFSKLLLINPSSLFPEGSSPMCVYCTLLFKRYTANPMPFSFFNLFLHRCLCSLLYSLI